MMLGMTTGGEGRSAGGQPKTWHRCLVEGSNVSSHRGVDDTYMHPLVFGVETAVRTAAAQKARKWYRGVLEAAERFMVTWKKN